jgi:beta-lactamase class A
MARSRQNGQSVRVPVGSEQLVAYLNEVLRGRAGVFGVYARNLQTDAVVGINAAQVMPAESTVKTAILLHYERGIEAGTLDPKQRVDFTPDRRFDGSGVLRYLDDGLSLTLDDLAWLMIIVSDNSATAMLVEVLGGPAEINKTTALLGCPTTRLNESITLERALAGESFSWSSPRDLAELYAHLGERARAMLFRQQHLIGLPRRLPHMCYAADVGIAMPARVYNKTGNGIGRFIDSGLFETDTASWIVAAMSDQQTDFASRPDDSAPAAFGAIGELIYDAWAEGAGAP